jgi:predicted NAD/FAD-dependent oxidoreductase
MTAIPKFIADGLDVELENAVEGVDVDQQHWHVTTQARKVFTSDHLILSPPLPQSLSLLGKHVSSRIPELVRKTLAGVEYERCIALMATLSGASGLPFPGAIQVGAEPIHWIADNSIKGVSPNSHSITVHAGPKFSEEYWEEDDKIVSDTLWQVSTAWLQPSVSIKSFQIQRWKFSKPRVTLPEPFIAISKPAALLFTGDAFAGPKVEGAALSGLSAAEYLIERGS